MISGITPLTVAEMTACRESLKRDDLPSGLADPDKSMQVVKEMFAAFYWARFGLAPGSTAVISTGETAIRFFDIVKREYLWAVSSAPDVTEHKVRKLVELPGRGWTIHEASWIPLVYPGVKL